jgi:hypothetical protein
LCQRRAGRRARLSVLGSPGHGEPTG